MSRTFLTLIVPLWVLALIVGSMIPPLGSTAAGMHFSLQHHLCHGLAFGSSAYLLVLLGRNARERNLAVAAMVVLAIMIEYSQHRIFGSPFESWDVRDDSFGALAAWGLGQYSALRHKLIRLPVAPIRETEDAA